MHGDRERYRTVAGVLLVSVGVVSILGIIVAEALYPGYSTSQQTISALGAVSGDGGPVQPSATIFNGAMVVSGLLLLVAGYAIHQVYGRRVLTAVVAVSGVGVTGVGLFPAQYALPHAVAAFAAFAGGGLSAVVAATVVDGPFRYVSVALGTLALAALAAFVALGGSTALGLGGLERLITYPTQIWTLAFGGYLLGETRRSSGEEAV